MKKIALMASVVAVALSWTACDNFELPEPKAPVNEQEPLFSTDELTVTALPEGAVLNLADYQYVESEAPIGFYEVNNWPAGYEVGMTAQISADKNFASYNAVECICADGVIAANGIDLNDAIAAQCGKAPVERKVYVRYQVTANRKDKPEFFIGGPDTTFGPYELTADVYSAYRLADAYNIHVIVDGAETVVSMSHSEANVYDDPVFSYLTLSSPVGGFRFYVTPADNNSEVYYGETDNSGKLILGTSGSTPVTLDGQVMVKVNMAELTYEAVPAYNNIYVPSDATGISKPTSAQMLFTTDFVTYHGFAYLKGRCQFTLDTIKKGKWGMGDEPGVLKKGGDFIPVETEGLYYVEMSLVNLTYKLTLVTSVGVVGDATSAVWNETSPIVMTAVAGTSDLVWEATTTLKDGDIKFVMNRSWGINLGVDGAEPSLDNLVFNAANWKNTVVGEAVITLDLSKLPYSATIVKK